MVAKAELMSKKTLAFQPGLFSMMLPTKQITELVSQKFKQGVDTAISVCLAQMQMFRGVLESDLLIAHTTKGKEMLILS